LSFEAWALFCLTETLLCLNPGPAVLVVVSLALTRGKADGLAASAGVLVANALYFAVSATGLAALLELSSGSFAAVRWLGAAYLVWLGARLLWRSLRGAPRAEAPAGPAAPGRAFWQGFVAQGANPTLLVYFTAILPQFVNAQAPLAPQIAILAASSLVIEFAVLCGYTALSQRASRVRAPRLRHLFERCAGGLLIAAGAGLAALARG
jgi:threonine/homoserine/homoserine lactone efflux protein